MAVAPMLAEPMVSTVWVEVKIPGAAADNACGVPPLQAGHLRRKPPVGAEHERGRRCSQAGNRRELTDGRSAVGGLVQV